MPTYDYKCHACGKAFAKVEHIVDHGRARVKCPKCRSAKVHRIFAPFYAKTVRKS